jgi:hypothetical protein
MNNSIQHETEESKALPATIYSFFTEFHITDLLTELGFKKYHIHRSTSIDLTIIS